MFRDDEQRARACRALLNVRQLGRFWGERGPTSECIVVVEDLSEGRSSVLSSGEGLLLLAAMTFWTGNHWGLTFADLLGRFDSGAFRAVVLLALSMDAGAEAIDRWLAVYDPDHSGSRVLLSWETQHTYRVVDARQRLLADGFVSIDNALSACPAMELGAELPLYVHGSNGNTLRYEGKLKES
jgi:hypothetical protein